MTFDRKGAFQGTEGGVDMPMTIDQFRQLAAYNRWANARLYAAALDLSDQAYRLHIGVFFGSLHGTLNHLLLTDRLWLKRLTGEGDYPNRLDAILYKDRVDLTRARIAEDNRLMAVIDKYDEAALANLHSYRTTSGMPQSQVLSVFRAVRDVVEIRCGAISGNMKVSFQAARSIG
jgi:uncharacterized damage-inducible protein DinB